jgi:hypothetical protein
LAGCGREDEALFSKNEEENVFMLVALYSFLLMLSNKFGSGPGVWPTMLQSAKCGTGLTIDTRLDISINL